MPLRLGLEPLKNAASRVWRLLHRGHPAGSYTDHCNRPLVAGDILRDDQDNRRKVISQPSPEELTLEVSEPDVAAPATGDER